MKDLLLDLNEVQKEAVRYIDGASMVIAGAGSGKTRVLTYKIAYIIEQGFDASNILALTFTNKAANEMKERIGQLVGLSEAKSLWMGTFHSIFAKILRNEAKSLGYSSNYTIYDTTDTKSVLKSIIKELNLNPEQYKINEIQNRISMAKNNLITFNVYASNRDIIERDKAMQKPHIADIYKLYVLRCKKADAMDFDDLLLNTNLLFRDFPNILEKYQQKFKYILVDEYQDTNFAQYLIIKKLSSAHKKICVVGDDAQSIYAFRGARLENIFNFCQDYPDYKLFKLEQNYRSTQYIVNAANSVIAKNQNQIPKNVFSTQESGERIQIYELTTDQEEGYLVAENIFNQSHNLQMSYNNFAVLYRTNAQSRIFEEALRKRNIPYKVYGSMSFYQRKEIKDVLAYMRLCVNPKDDEALKRVINYPTRGIGDGTIEKIEMYASHAQTSIWEIISNLDALPLNISNNILQKLKQFRNLIIQFQEKINYTDAYEIASEITQLSGILNELKSENTYENIARLENIEELLNSIKEFVDIQKNIPNEIVTLNQYLENVSLLTDLDNEDKEDKDKVKLMTIHAAKGLEFNYVHIAGLEEGLFPSSTVMLNPEEIEEERRLFYVALTRAKNKVVISYVKNRYKWGKPTTCTPSRFIFEIDPKYIDYKGNKRNSMSNKANDKSVFKKSNHETSSMLDDIQHSLQEAITRQKKKLINLNTATQMDINNIETNFGSDDTNILKVGMRVQHLQFGCGTIVEIEGKAPNHKAIIKFDDNGEKKLLLKFARLKILQ